jgi:beta-phosphoglucomutase
MDGILRMKIKGVLFDFDGVIVKSMDLHYRAWQHAFHPFNIQIDRIEFYKLEGSGIERVGKSLMDKYKIDPKLLGQLIKKKHRYYDKIDRFQLYDGLIPLLDFLKTKKIGMVIVTGGSFSRVQERVNRYLAGYFSGIITPEVIKETKPSPQPYLKGAEILGLTPDQCLVMENAPLGIHAAKAAGMRVIAVQTTLPEEYLKEADYVIKNFDQAKILLNKLLN